jgi:carbonic anhydrase
MVEELLRNNRRWAAARASADPAFFRRLTEQQRPRYLWIGCADSRVPANTIIGLDPGQVFVHRNIANLAPATDINFLSVLQYAVEALEVRDIIVCGHYGCGGVRAVIEGLGTGLVDHWLGPVDELLRRHRAEIEAIGDPARRVDLLCELNVRAQVASIAATPTAQAAWRRGQPLAVHGWVYALSDGLIRDMELTIASPEALAALEA